MFALLVFVTGKGDAMSGGGSIRMFVTLAAFIAGLNYPSLPPEVIQKANSLGTAPIQPAQRLRVMPTKFATTVSKSANTLLLTDDGKFFKIYRVGTGQHSMTPIGSFKIRGAYNRLVQLDGAAGAGRRRSRPLTPPQAASNCRR